MTPPIASRAEWLAARVRLLSHEKEATRALDRLRQERRALPWVPVDEPYVFEGPDGAVTLSDLFGGRSQLAIYHFMLTPGSDHVCPGCSFVSDHVDAARQHFEHADLSFAAVSRAPLARIETVRRRMGWRFRWVSSSANDFNYDFGVSFGAGRPEAAYNFGASPSTAPDLPGASVFAKDADGRIHHTYSTYARGVELLVGAFNWLDLAPKGRNEVGGIMSWVRRHDEYGDAVPPGHDCCS